MAQIVAKHKMAHLSQYLMAWTRSTHNGHHLSSAIHLRSYFSKLDSFLEIKWSVEVKHTVTVHMYVLHKLVLHHFLIQLSATALCCVTTVLIVKKLLFLSVLFLPWKYPLHILHLWESNNYFLRLGSCSLDRARTVCRKIVRKFSYVGKFYSLQCWNSRFLDSTKQCRTTQGIIWSYFLSLICLGSYLKKLETKTFVVILRLTYDLSGLERLNFATLYLEIRDLPTVCLSCFLDQCISTFSTGNHSVKLQDLKISRENSPCKLFWDVQ